MTEFEIICMANSRKMGGRCIGGLKTDGSGWIRPVIAGSPLRLDHCKYPDGGQIAKLDVMKVRCTKRVQDKVQPENWLISKRDPFALKSRRRSGKFFRSEVLPAIAANISSGPELIHGYNGRVNIEEISDSEIKQSLAIVEPQSLRWTARTNTRGDRQIRAFFNLGGHHYNLPLTDDDYEASNLSEMQTGETIEVAESDEKKILFTISLGQPLEGNCYKLVAGVIMLDGEMWQKALK